jgi:two-component system chemotaxis response regulator CheB
MEMGADGAAGLLRQAGAVTMVQDKASSVVFGMAREAPQRGAADDPLAPKAIARALAQLTP